MGLVYLPTFMIHINQNVGKYIIHGSYGIEIVFQSKPKLQFRVPLKQWTCRPYLHGVHASLAKSNHKWLIVECPKCGWILSLAMLSQVCLGVFKLHGSMADKDPANRNWGSVSLLKNSKFTPRNKNSGGTSGGTTQLDAWGSERYLFRMQSWQAPVESWFTLVLAMGSSLIDWHVSRDILAIEGWFNFLGDK